MNERGVPQWAADYIGKWRDALFLYEWGIRTSTSPHPDEDASGSTKAVCRVWPVSWDRWAWYQGD